MKILSKSTKVQFERGITLEWVENVFKTKNVAPLRWAITEIDELKSVATIAYSAIYSINEF